MTTMEITPAFRAAEAWHPRVLKHQSLQSLKQTERYFERMVLSHLSAYLRLVLQHYESTGIASGQEAEVDLESNLLLNAVDHEMDWEAFRQDIAGAYSRSLFLGIKYGAKDLPKFGKTKTVAELFSFADPLEINVDALKNVWENLVGQGGIMAEQQALDSLYAIYGKDNIDKALKKAGIEYTPGKKPKGPPPTTDYATLQIEWDTLADPEVLNWITTRTSNLITGIDATTKERVRQQIKVGVMLGESRDEIAERLQSVMDDLPAWRAKLIAQTEVITAHSAGAVMTYKKSGNVEGKRWVDGQAGACAICSGLNGKIIHLTGQFQDTSAVKEGNYAQKVQWHPGPPAHPGCRCTVAPVVKIAPPPPDKPLELQVMYLPQ